MGVVRHAVKVMNVLPWELYSHLMLNLIDREVQAQTVALGPAELQEVG